MIKPEAILRVTKLKLYMNGWLAWFWKIVVQDHMKPREYKFNSKNFIMNICVIDHRYAYTFYSNHMYGQNTVSSRKML